ncbi:MAG: hypothetical protein WCC11_12045 [Gammaproteobacteria bacterium]
MSISKDDNLSELYAVLIKDYSGHGEDPRGEFVHYSDAYNAFEKAVGFVDELNARVNNYPLTFDTVLMLKGNSLVLLWQRPPQRTRRLMAEWSRRKGYGSPKIVPINFAGVGITDQQTIAIVRSDRPLSY